MSRKLTVLSIDGGGIRGIIPAVILAKIENELRERSGDPHMTLADYFDLIAGTSIGGVLACYYLMPPQEGQTLHSRYAATEAIKIFEERGEEIFLRNSRKGCLKVRYKAHGREKIFEEIFGDARLNDLTNRCLITAYDLNTQEAIFFTHPKDREVNKNKRDFYLKDVAMATSAAPTYFPPVKLTVDNEEFVFIDGGVFANNPTLCALTEFYKLKTGIRQHFTTNDLLVVSIGTGEKNEREKAGEYDYEKLKNKGKIRWGNPVVNIMLSASERVVHTQVKALFPPQNDEAKQRYGILAPYSPIKGFYWRIDPELTLGDDFVSDRMDDASPEHVRQLKSVAEKCLESGKGKKKVKEITDKLLENHQLINS